DISIENPSVAVIRYKYSDFSVSGEFRAGKIALLRRGRLSDGRGGGGVLKLGDFFANVLFFRNFVP
ncbi:MAG: hypothetical protein LUH46_03950, partial [Alistipes sp.]|nr:hypothetical protein [Alistipes sp.]